MKCDSFFLFRKTGVSSFRILRVLDSPGFENLKVGKKNQKEQQKKVIKITKKNNVTDRSEKVMRKTFGDLW